VNINVTCRHQQVEPAVRDYAVDRIEKVLRVFERLDAAQVVFDHEHDDYVVEAIVSAPKGAQFTARAEGRDLRATIDSACQKLEAQVRNWKDRLVDHRSQGTPDGRPPEPDETPRDA
jgi:putative sigma-54 modulation protein